MEHSSSNATSSSNARPFCLQFGCKIASILPDLTCRGYKIGKGWHACGRSMHTACASGGETKRCSSCYSKKEAYHQKMLLEKIPLPQPVHLCNFPNCAITPDSPLAKHPCKSSSCNNEIHLVCLKGSGLPPQYTVHPAQRCFDCVHALIGDFCFAPDLTGNRFAPATTPSPPAGNFYF